MSAVNILTTPTRALIFTDAAAYDLDGRLVTVFDKAEIAEAGRLVITGRGNAFFPRLVASMLERLRWNIDDVEADGGAVFEEAFERAEHLMQDAGKAMNDCFVVGWSKLANAPKIAQWSTDQGAGTPRFSMVGSVLAPEMSDDGYDRVKRALGPITRAAVDNDRLGLEVMKAQRMETGSAEYAAAGQYLVGGHVQRTDVTANGITKRIVHRWPEDRIGERIRPIPAIDVVAAPNVTPMNRAERRRLVRSKRRAA